MIVSHNVISVKRDNCVRMDLGIFSQIVLNSINLFNKDNTG